MNDIKTEEITFALSKICNSKSFANSGRNSRLLKFLTNKALKKEFVKEHVVGFELFEKDYDPNERNSKVRVYMYQLRQKLIEYYANEGKVDKIQFEIKKGQYNITFKKIKKNKFSFSLLKWIVLLFTSFLLFYLINTLLKTDHYLWTSFFNSKNKTICFISDQYIVSKKEGRHNVFSHISEIDNEAELNIYKAKKKDTAYTLVNFSYVTKMAPIAIQSLSRKFWENNADFSIELESDFKYDDLKNANLIFIGQFSSLHKSETLFLDNSKVFSNNKGRFIYNLGNETIKYFNNGKSDKSLDYAMVSYRKMDNGNSVLFFYSNHDIGVISTTKNFTNQTWLKKFYAQFPKDTKQFNALFKVTGYKRTGLNSELEKIEFIDK
ncbi:hypothetical protein FHR24_003026 [Wenyingzhuangia heitensis]|uniref:Transcriptional regulatory protein, C terminal n=1 Tax=Wenyingzhuangia heitensis TaxID=1487859 RepID=A0ABX0UCH7_9FLAO|nr:hypothetical protein [Wenyingzhuangia heitensis]NIJ46537.1 hypothetical protein [Wenyingzhuangia heitensis]